MRRHLLSGIVAAVAGTLTASSAFAGCCGWSSGYGYGSSYGYGSGYGYGSTSVGVTYNVPAVSFTVPATVSTAGYGYQSYRPSYWANQGPSYTGPNVTNFAQPYYNDEGYSYPYGYQGGVGYRSGYYGTSAYPYVRSNWASMRWRSAYSRPYVAQRSYVNWRYQSQYRRPIYAARQVSVYRGSVGRPYGGVRRPYGY